LRKASEGTRAEDTVIVVAGGGPPSNVLLPQRAAVIAADGGLDRALALGLRVDVAIGDFDSVSSEALVRAKAAGTRFVQHAKAKDATDLELALELAAASKPRRILLIGAEGGRLDHLLASLLALGSERYAESEVDAILVAGLRAVGLETPDAVARGDRAEHVLARFMLPHFQP